MDSLMIPVIAYGNRIEIDLLISLNELVEGFEKMRIPVEILFIGNESLIVRAKNCAVAEFMGSTHTHILFPKTSNLGSDLDILDVMKHDIYITEDWLMLSKKWLRKIIDKNPNLKYENDMPGFSERSTGNFYALFDVIVQRALNMNE